METMKVPGPEHPITVVASARRVVARYQGHALADSGDALVLREAGYRPVFYFPRADVAMDFLTRTDRDTYCPYKGHAAYFTVTRDGAIAENAAWTYEDPYPAMAPIAGRIAFFPNLVDIHEVDSAGARIAPEEVVLHTDAGDGASQADHWPPNAPNPTPPG
jgi:uncharacterized protein (DUF427 family)